MTGAKLFLLAALCQAQPARADQDPASLVTELGSTRYATREAAARSLERIGRPALGALELARESRDPEVRIRAGILAERIESALLSQPTQLRLEFQDTPLADVAKSLSIQSGFRIELYPANMPSWRQRRIRLNGSGPVDFWKAIDRLCDVGNLQYNAALHGFAGHGEPMFALTEGVNRTINPISDHGPFRVSLLGVDYQRHLTYAASGPGSVVPSPPRPAGLELAQRPPSLMPRLNPVTSVQFSAQMLVAAEPRLTLSRARGLELVEAVDEQGNSLVPDSDAEAVHDRYAGYIGMSTGPVVQIQAQLRRPETAGAWIKKLRGFIPMTVSSRRPNPLVIPLGSAVGKTFENRHHRLSVHDIRPSPTNHNLLIELSINSTEVDAPSDTTELDAFSDGLQRPDPQHLQIEVVDIRGHLITWFQSRAHGETARFTLTLTNQTDKSQLKELRYFTLSRASVKIPFEFGDIPMP